MAWCDWKFLMIFDSLRLSPQRTSEAARDKSDWTITVSNGDLTTAIVIRRNQVYIGPNGYLPLNYSELDEHQPDFRQNLLKVHHHGWQCQSWIKASDSKLPDYLSGLLTRVMGFRGQNVSARTDSGKGAVGQSVHVKVAVKADGLPKDLTGYGEIQVGPLLSNLTDYGQQCQTIPLPGGVGEFRFTLLPVTDYRDQVNKRRLARAGSNPVYQVHQMAGMKLPQCCINVLGVIAWRMRAHERLVAISQAKGWAKDIKGWAQKLADPRWVTDTAKRARDEAIAQVKSRLKPPPSKLDSSAEKEVLMLSALLLAHDLESLTDHALDHKDDLAGLWEELHGDIVEWKDALVEEAQKNVDQKLLHQVVKAEL